MNGKTARILRNFITRGNPDLDRIEIGKLLKQVKKDYQAMNPETRAEFKSRIK